MDTSIERLEFAGSPEFAAHGHMRVNGRPLELQRLPGNQAGVGLRYRRTALYPSLHPGILPHMPLMLTITHNDRHTLYRLDQNRRLFERCPKRTPQPAAGPDCKKLPPQTGHLRPAAAIGIRKLNRADGRMGTDKARHVEA